MSKRYWNSAGERNLLRCLGVCSYLGLVNSAKRARRTNSDLEDEDSEGEGSEDEEEEGVRNRVETAVNLLLIAATLMQHAEVHKPIEDTDIEFGKALVLNDFNESQCLMYFRFKKVHLRKVLTLLWPRLEPNLAGERTRIFCTNRYRVHYETAMLIMLYRFSRPIRIRPEMESFFGMRKSHISAVLQTITTAMYAVSQPYLNNPGIFRHRMALYARKVYRKCELLQNVWGFIDGTLRKICRPTYFQRQAYSGHKRCHGVKFQAIYTPDGLIACLFGPMNGNRHDSHMLRESQVLEQLTALMPAEEEEIIYLLYGDPAYPQSIYLIGGYPHPAPGTQEADFNTAMSKVREAVEWAFKEIIAQWRFLDYRASIKIFEMPIARYYTIAAFLQNLRSTVYDNQTSVYFDMDTMELEDYIKLVDE